RQEPAGEVGGLCPESVAEGLGNGTLTARCQPQRELAVALATMGAPSSRARVVANTWRGHEAGRTVTHNAFRALRGLGAPSCGGPLPRSGPACRPGSRRRGCPPGDVPQSLPRGPSADKPWSRPRVDVHDPPFRLPA